jgi:hypothetical protein
MKTTNNIYCINEQIVRLAMIALLCFLSYSVLYIVETEASTKKTVGAYVQLENGHFRVAWAPVFGELEISGNVANPDCIVKYRVNQSSGQDDWRVSNNNNDNWLHYGIVHAIKEKDTENGKVWITYRILYWDGKDFVGIHYAVCPDIAYKGLTVWKGLSTEWSIVVEAVRKAGYMDVVNNANLLGKLQKTLAKRN